MTSRQNEQKLPMYGLVGFHGERHIDGYGWDLNSIVHLSVEHGVRTIVGVDRRTTDSGTGRGPRTAIPDDLARKSVAVALVLELPGIGDEVFDLADQVAREDEAWQECEVWIDGESTLGCAREYRDLWVAYTLTSKLIIYVLCPVAWRPGVVELEELVPGELGVDR